MCGEVILKIQSCMDTLIWTFGSHSGLQTKDLQLKYIWDLRLKYIYKINPCAVL